MYFVFNIHYKQDWKEFDNMTRDFIMGEGSAVQLTTSLYDYELAMEDEDDLNGGQRDILDWCYVVTRVLVLFSVVYFYSSLARYVLFPFYDGLSFYNLEC